MEIWYNPSCSKCTLARATLDEAGVEYYVRDYLREPPSRAELADVLRRLGVSPAAITRFNEPAAGALGLHAGAELREDEWLDVLVAHPQLIQRPILLVEDGTAYIGRDAESLQAAISAES